MSGKRKASDDVDGAPSKQQRAEIAEQLSNFIDTQREASLVLLDLLPVEDIEMLCGTNRKLALHLCGRFADGATVDDAHESLLRTLVSRATFNVDDALQTLRVYDRQFYAEFWTKRLTEHYGLSAIADVNTDSSQVVRAWCGQAICARIDQLRQARVDAALAVLDALGASAAAVQLADALRADNERLFEAWSTLSVARSLYLLLQRRSILAYVRTAGFDRIDPLQMYTTHKTVLALRQNAPSEGQSAASTWLHLVLMPTPAVLFAIEDGVPIGELFTSIPPRFVHYVDALQVDPRKTYYEALHSSRNALSLGDGYGFGYSTQAGLSNGWLLGSRTRPSICIFFGQNHIASGAMAFPRDNVTFPYMAEYRRRAVANEQKNGTLAQFILLPELEDNYVGVIVELLLRRTDGQTVERAFGRFAEPIVARRFRTSLTMPLRLITMLPDVIYMYGEDGIYRIDYAEEHDDDTNAYTNDRWLEDSQITLVAPVSLSWINVGIAHWNATYNSGAVIIDQLFQKPKPSDAQRSDQTRTIHLRWTVQFAKNTPAVDDSNSSTSACARPESSRWTQTPTVHSFEVFLLTYDIQRSSHLSISELWLYTPKKGLVYATNYMNLGYIYAPTIYDASRFLLKFFEQRSGVTYATGELALLPNWRYRPAILYLLPSLIERTDYTPRYESFADTPAQPSLDDLLQVFDIVRSDV